MTVTRHKLTVGELNTILLRQAICACGCGELIAGRPIQREHLVQLAMGGADTIDNIAMWLEEHSKRKSFGSKATSAGSDAHARAKHRRLTGKNKPKVKRDWPSRPLQSRGFEKRRPTPERMNRNGE